MAQLRPVEFCRSLFIVSPKKKPQPLPKLARLS